MNRRMLNHSINVAFGLLFVVAVLWVILAVLTVRKYIAPRLDTSTETTSRETIGRMRATMTDAEWKQFQSDCLTIAVRDVVRSELSRKPLTPFGEHTGSLRGLHGLNAEEVHARAEMIRSHFGPIP